ncbi:MAG: tyrosine-type recombinase/integrase [Betaproteobacteria bacterium]|nr:tyrosine-type recombinase/integrase [Betaproteobacteria bacterium]
MSSIARLKLFNPDNRLNHQLSPEALERLLEVLRTDQNRPVCNVALFLLSTGARLNEALTATWDQIDTANRVWRIPAANSKSKRVRSVPLNDSAMEVLEGLGTEVKVGRLFVSSKTGEPLGHIHKGVVAFVQRWPSDTAPAYVKSLFASFLVNSGKSPLHRAEDPGHSSHAGYRDATRSSIRNL